MISYCSVPLVFPSAELLASIEAAIPQAFPQDFVERTQARTNLSSLDYRGYLPQGPVRIGVLTWPTGATRFATFYGLVGEAGLAAIREAVSQNPVEQLVLNDGHKVVVAHMSMLPARSLWRVVKGTPGLYLLTLVDQRFYWWFRSGAIVTNDPADPDSEPDWGQLYANLGTALEIGIGADAVPGAYLTPTSQYAQNRGPLPPLLDAVARSVGQRIVCDYYGTVHAYDYSSSLAIYDANRGLVKRLAGDELDLEVTEDPNDLELLLPANFACVFKREDDGAASLVDYTIVVPLASLDLPEFSGVTGFAGTKQFHSFWIATFESGVITNLAELQALAEQAAGDYYLHQAARIDAVYEGFVPWRQDGLTDLVEFSHAGTRLFTRVRTGPWSDRAGEDEPEELIETQFVYLPETIPARVGMTPGHGEGILFGIDMATVPATLTTDGKYIGLFNISSSPVDTGRFYTIIRDPKSSQFIVQQDCCVPGGSASGGGVCCGCDPLITPGIICVHISGTYHIDGYYLAICAASGTSQYHCCEADTYWAGRRVQAVGDAALGDPVYITVVCESEDLLDLSVYVGGSEGAGGPVDAHYSGRGIGTCENWTTIVPLTNDVGDSPGVAVVTGFVATCGTGSGASGGGTLVPTACCPDGLPLNLTAVVTDVSGCSCLEGAYELFYNSAAGGYWASAVVTRCGMPFSINLICVAGVWLMTFYVDNEPGGFSGVPADAVDCDLPQLDWNAHTTGFCGGTVSVSVVG